MLGVGKELVLYAFKVNNDFFLLVISSFFGWNIIIIHSSCIIFKKSAQVFQNFGVFLLRNFLGCYKFFLQHLLLKGMGYKNAIIGSKLILRLAPSHRLVYNIQDNLKLTYINKQYLVLKSKSLSLVKKVVFFLQKFGKINAYKKIGIFLKGNIIFVKTSSKKSKF